MSPSSKKNVDRKVNPALYRQLSEPFASLDEANTASKAFFEELYALREKHHIADVYVILSLTWKDGDGEANSYIPMSIGDTRRSTELTAFAHGFEQANSDARIERVAEMGKKVGES